MLRIVSDTSTLYSTTQAKEAGFFVSPLTVNIGSSSYREFDDISSEQFVELIRQGNMPTSSQPAVGDVLELYQQFPEDDILNVAMCDGLSGTYNSAVTAAELCENSGSITVLNTRTLCAPHRFLVERAVELAAQNKAVPDIVAHLEQLMDTCKSYLIPADFAYLRRGGRLSPLVSYVGQAAKLAPVLTQTEDGRQLIIAGVRRSFSHAIQYVGKALENLGVGEHWRVYITHASAPEMAQKAYDLLKPLFPAAHIEVLPLSPAFITQGGPNCVAVQAIRGSLA